MTGLLQVSAAAFKQSCARPPASQHLLVRGSAGVLWCSGTQVLRETASCRNECTVTRAGSQA